MYSCNIKADQSRKLLTTLSLDKRGKQHAYIDLGTQLIFNNLKAIEQVNCQLS